MALLKITFKSWRIRKLGIVLSVFAIALGISLFLAIEKLRVGVKGSFTGMISKTDLVVGARTAPLSLILNSVFHIGTASKTVEYNTFQKFKRNKRVKWAIPISLGDSHKGYRVVGTSADMFEHFRFRNNQQLKFKAGNKFIGLFDVVIGADVAQDLKYTLGSKIILSHGVSRKTTQEHSQSPFKVNGILERTFTPLDRVLLVSLPSIEAIHAGWENGAPPTSESLVTTETDNLKVKQVSAFFLGLKSRVHVLSLQREILNFNREPLTGAIPALVMAEFWATLGYIESALQLISAMVILVSLLTMLISIYSSLNERRREMAIFRAIGTASHKVFALFLFESMLLTTLGVVLGWSLAYAALALFAPLLEVNFGIFITIGTPHITEIYYMAAVFFFAFLIGLLPAYRAYKNSLADGLAIKV